MTNDSARDAFISAVLTRDYRVEIVPWLERSWLILKANLWFAIGTTALIVLIGVGIECVPIIGWIAGTILLGPVWAGLSMVMLKLARRQPASLSDAFAGFGPAFLPLLAVGVIYQVGILIGLLLLIIPGIYLLVAWSFSFLLVLDRGLAVFDALELSRKMVQKHFFLNLAMLAVSLLLICGGLALLLVGAFIAVPLVTILFSVAYQEIFEGPGESHPPEATVS